MLKTIDSSPITQLPKTRRRFFSEGRAKINDLFLKTATKSNMKSLA